MRDLEEAVQQRYSQGARQAQANCQQNPGSPNGGCC